MSIALGFVLTRLWGLPTGRDGKPVPALTATGWQLQGGSVVLLPLALVTEGAPPALDWVAVAGFAWLTLIGTALAYALFFGGLHRIPAGQFALLGLASPVTAALLGWLVLDQSLTVAQLVGMAMVLIAIPLGQRSRRVVSASDSDGEFHQFRRVVSRE